ncbi:GGDEF domain-containing protein [Actinoplanes sp. TRM 88003]|uniref:GGDEF domain-containing protein n=1 Tax=Paractinoplanes aksuensis TaxID=2939490 RepID=A0ABT1E234_9ACTN|nr:diguanylate cyclase [Actinoplanes aksuensis]MCO8277102.1 GGDEF domain-containing protein [Actinoplanes aksuensis]
MELRRRLTPDPVLAGLSLFSLALVGWFLTGPGGATVSWAVQTALDVTIAVGAWRLARLNTGHRHARRFWLAVLATGVCCTLGDGFQTVLTLFDQAAGHQPHVVQTGLVVLGMLIVVVAMVFHPLGGTGRQRLRLWLDAATVLAGVAVFLWYFLLAGVVTHGNRTDLAGAAATSAVMLLITVGLLKLMLGGTAPFARIPGLVAALGVAGTAVAASTVTLVTGNDDPGVIYVSQLLPCLLMPVSMRLQSLHMRRAATRPAAPARRRSSRLPYAAVVAVQLLLLAALLGHSGDLRIWGVAVGAVTITGLVLSRQTAAFTDNERLLSELDSRMAEVHELHDELHHRATHDALTGLANRSLFEQRLGELPAGAEVGLLLIDLDGFKPVNDSYGHHAGDQVLVAVAERLAAWTPPDGLAVRLGGDEFAVLLPGPAPADGLVAALERPIMLPGTAEVTVGASVGRATGSPADATHLLREADAAMYRTKAERKSAKPLSFSM